MVLEELEGSWKAGAFSRSAVVNERGEDLRREAGDSGSARASEAELVNAQIKKGVEVFMSRKTIARQQEDEGRGIEN